MKDFIEHERKMRKLVQQSRSPMLEAHKLFANKNICRMMNNTFGAINMINQHPILKYISSINNIKAYCLPNSLINATSKIQGLSNNFVLMATQANSIFSAQSAINKFIQQHQKLKETVERLQLLNQIFAEYYPIFDEVLIDKIRLMRKRDSKSLEKCIINYYKKNKYENLIKAYKIISNKQFVQNRIHILDSCIKAITKLPRKDRYNIIIPTLTAQITGLMEDCIELIPKDYQKTTPNLKGRRLLLDYANSNFKSMYCIALENIVEKTFCRTEKFKQLSIKEQEKYNKIRPGILHGDECCLDYGTEKNLILSWLELFLLVKIGEYFYNCNN